MNTWRGSLHLKDEMIQDVHISSQALPAGSELRFLSIVEVGKIPLCLAAGPECDVWTESCRAEEWFDDVLVSTITNVQDDQDRQNEWWLSSGQQSRMGVLVQVQTPASIKSAITELLFYAVTENQKDQRPPTPPPPLPSAGADIPSNTSSEDCIIRVKALPLSSTFLDHLPTPPGSPSLFPADEAQFLPSVDELRLSAAEAQKKRKRVNDAFDQATESRKKARRKGGAGVTAAASRIDEVNTLVGMKKPKSSVSKPSSDTAKRTEVRTPKPKIEGTRVSSISVIESPVEAFPRRPLSRSPSMSSEIRPVSRRGTLDEPKRSTLSRVSSLSEAATVEERNKEAISRIVLAGMRLYGLQQRKKPMHSRRESQIISEEASTAASEEVAKDDEFKNIYHTTYKAAVLAFRSHIANEQLYLTPEPLREIVDRLLAIFCSDPLT